MKVTIQIECAKCASKHIETHEMPFDACVPIPRVPYGWVMLNNNIFVCDKHNIEFFEKEKSALVTKSFVEELKRILEVKDIGERELELRELLNKAQLGDLFDIFDIMKRW